MIDHLTKLETVLHEFVSDIEAVGIAKVAKDWPDLAITYRKALAVLNREPKVRA